MNPAQEAQVLIINAVILGMGLVLAGRRGCFPVGRVYKAAFFRLPT
jgi:hypothetical protein